MIQFATGHPVQSADPIPAADTPVPAVSPAMTHPGAAARFAIMAMLVALPSSGHAADASGTGTFSEEQFERGAALYQEQCASCHGPELDDGASVALTGPTFRRTWSRPETNVATLLEVIATTMPPGQGGVLSGNQNLDLLAFLLGSNGVVLGSEPLRDDSAYLGAIPLARSDEPFEVAENFITGPRGIAPTGPGPDMNALLNAGAGSDDWLHHNKSYQGVRYSGLQEINRSNVSDLQEVCAYRMDSTATLQTGPIVYQGTMYVSDVLVTAALDAATCNELWRYQWDSPDRIGWPNNRGVAIKDGYVVRGSADGYLYALDAAAGHLLWARQIADPWLGEALTMPPTIYEDMVLIGPAGSENAISGWVGAWSLADGELLWKFYTVPEAAAGGGASWGNPQGIKLGGGAVWTPLSVDPELEEVYVAVTNPAPDLPAWLRPGENLYTNSIVALDLHSGELNWYQSIVPNDDHDWDLTQVTPVLKASRQDLPRDLVATVGKDGILRLLDQASHQAVHVTPITTILNQDVPVTTEGVVACPGVVGGVLWSSPAWYAPEKLLITGAIDSCSRFQAAEHVEFTPGRLYMGGTARPEGEASGRITAVNVLDGEIRWQYQTPLPQVGAITATAGGLIIAGAMEGNLLFLDAATGELLHSIDTGAPIGGGNVSYSVAGRQYIAVGSGNAMLTLRPPDLRQPQSNRIVVYALAPP